VSPLVSVVVPVWNRAHCIEEAIDTVRVQEGVDLECVVVDDGSTDETVAVVHAAARSDRRVRLVEVAHGGPSAARNAGIAAAAGELIAFHDSDNLLPRRRLARQVQRLEASGADGVVGRYEVQPVGSVEPPGWVQGRSEELGGWSWISLLVRRAPLVAIGGFDEELRIGEDLDLLMRLRAHGCTIDFLDEVVTVRRWFGDNLTYEMHDGDTTFRAMVRRHMARQRRP
jgi:O-antigen biosynthesis protein